ncbi:MAG: DNA-deoxyinosine glycosylase, partial [Bacilli bacterium]|nr:DNA-deoxyinosine glycosylase [Bacilli bacterium]
HNIEPIYNEQSKILILGTMPSIVSREVQFFYAHPQNRFWHILETIFEVTLNSIQDKKNFLLRHNIALWDVISSCDIQGSSDSSIKNIVVNDIPKILEASDIQCIFCTGKKSYVLFKKYFDVSIPVICLPSPSSANAACSFDKLVFEYSQILHYLPKKQ